MDKKAGKHSEIMAFLRNYIAETPLETLQKEITEVSSLSFAGATAEEYFAHFPLYYEKSAPIYEPLLAQEISLNQAIDTVNE